MAARDFPRQGEEVMMLFDNRESQVKILVSILLLSLPACWLSVEEWCGKNPKMGSGEKLLASVAWGRFTHKYYYYEYYYYK